MYENFFSYSKHSSVTDMLLVLRLPSFNILLYVITDAPTHSCGIITVMS